MGSSFTALGFQFMMGNRTISGVIADTTSAVWVSLQPMFMSPRKKSKWKHIAEKYLDFFELAKLHRFNSCIKCFPKSGSLYFNYKGYFSVILLSCADTDALFTSVHAGEFDKNSDGSVLGFPPWRDAGEGSTVYPISNFPTAG
jgi:hypothetical protein